MTEADGTIENKIDLEQFKCLPKGPWKEVGEGQYIWDADDQTILQVRGWGHLQNQFGEEEAVRIQTVIGKAAASIPNLLCELEEARKEIELLRNDVNKHRSMVMAAMDVINEHVPELDGLIRERITKNESTKMIGG